MPTPENDIPQALPHFIRRIVCSGGGAKGVVYPAAYRALINTGAFKQVEHVAGASAGAITASFMAVGMSKKTFRDKLLNTNFESLMGKNVYDEHKKKNKKEQEEGKKKTPLPPGCCFLTKDGSELLNFLRTSLIESTLASLEQLPTEAIDDLPLDDQTYINNLKEKLRVGDYKLLFSDLAKLNQLFPHQFKKLAITAVRYPTGELQVFDGDSTPDVEIALAARASASIPAVLEPVEIEVNGEPRRFIDGGMYDNLPTDYFDRTVTGEYQENQHKQQTLVFAFGEGLNNSKNPVYQGLYGARWDEVIAKSLLNDIFHDAIDKTLKVKHKEQYLSVEREAFLLQTFAKQALKREVDAHHLKTSEADKLFKTLKDSINDLLHNPERHQTFWQDYALAPSLEMQLTVLSNHIKEKLSPVLYEAGFTERLKRNTLATYLASLELPYENTKQKELGYNKLRTDYALRTVELRVGDIKTRDFTKANTYARIMDSLGYIDTINHLVNHDLYGEDFNPDEFYKVSIDNFKKIYKAVLVGSGKNPDTDPLLQQLNAHTTQATNPNLQAMYLIKDYVEKNLNSGAAFALSRAVELTNKAITPEALYKETYVEAFKRSTWFSRSTITNTSYFLSSSLEKRLSDENLFELQHKRSKEEQKDSRAEKVLSALKDIPCVDEACSQSLQALEQKEFKKKMQGVRDDFNEKDRPLLDDTEQRLC